MTEQLDGRLHRAADDAVRDLSLDHPRSLSQPEVPSARGRRRTTGRWLSASAVLAAAAVLAVVMWVGASRAPDATGPATSGSVPSTSAVVDPPIARLRSAFDATASAEAWSGELNARLGATSYVYQAPDRLEVRSTDGGGAVVASVTVGDDMYAIDDGRWVRTSPPVGGVTSVLPGFITMLADAPCVTSFEGALVAWSVPTPGCDAAGAATPGSLTPGAMVWRVELDDGRLGRLQYGEVPSASEEATARPADPSSTDLWVRAGAVFLGALSFSYDDAPPVTVPTDYTDLRGARPSGSDPTGTTVVVGSECSVEVRMAPGSTPAQAAAVSEQFREATVAGGATMREYAAGLERLPGVASVRLPESGCPPNAAGFSVVPAT